MKKASSEQPSSPAFVHDSRVECLYRHTPSKTFYAILKRNGRQVKRSLKTKDRELARRRLEQLRQRVSYLKSAENANMMFAELTKQWLSSVSPNLKRSTIERYERSLEMLEEYFKKPVRNISRIDCEAWATARSKGFAARTFNHDMHVLSRVLALAEREGLILDNPAQVLKRRKQPIPQIVFPSREQFAVIIEEIRAEPRAKEAAEFCEFLAYSGCRLNEATQMRWGDINFQKSAFTITGGELGTKNHEARTVPLFPSLERLLLRMRAALPNPPEAENRVFTIRSAKKALATASSKANFPHFTHHSLRHFFCSNAIEEGADFKVIASWVGHKDGGMLVAKTYGHLRDEHSTLMAKRMTFGVREPVQNKMPPSSS
ncbi:MAG: site-specific integrase [Verrucomicrobia bacterium]|nr:site-specific integrase [Verrucomicrobiota bacterium]